MNHSHLACSTRGQPACTYDAGVLAAGNNGEEGRRGMLNRAFLPSSACAEHLPAGTVLRCSPASGLRTYFLFALVGIGGLAYSRVE